MFQLQKGDARDSLVLSLLRQDLQRQALLARSYQSAFGKCLLAMRQQRAEHATAKNPVPAQAFDFPAVTFSRDHSACVAGRLSRLLCLQAIHRSERTSAADVPWLPLRSFVLHLDDAPRLYTQTDQVVVQKEGTQVIDV